MGDLLSDSSPLEGLGRFQATWAVPLPPAHGTVPGGSLALGLACPGRTWTWLRVSQDGVVVTTPPNPDDLDPSQCQGILAAARPRSSSAGAQTQAQGTAPQLWQKKGDSGHPHTSRGSLCPGGKPSALLTASSLA